MDIAELVASQRTYFRSCATLDVAFRRRQLIALRQAVKTYEQRLLDAIHQDLGKSETEAYICEIGLFYSELTYALRHLRRWTRSHHASTPLSSFPARSFMVEEPYGVVLIMSPWNYPVLLLLEPLIGAIAAGNTAILKPSAYSPCTSAVIAEMIASTFPREYVAVVTGGREENTELLNQRFDYIFFTGGVTVGKLVMEKASRFLTPITLELGGKSPVIVDYTADLRLAARRIAFGKFLNCGQTCIAPDYVLVEDFVHDQLVALLISETKQLFGEHPLKNADYGKIISEKHFARVQRLLCPSKIVWGGEIEPEHLRLAPTILTGVTPSDAVMQEEIFGPILPILRVKDTEEAYSFVREREKPLALYLFSNNRPVVRRFLREVPFGGGCVNDTIMHLATSHMPFGGVGNSGMGQYHGDYTFRTFSHRKAVLRRFAFPDIALRYQPYTALKNRLCRIFLR